MFIELTPCMYPFRYAAYMYCILQKRRSVVSLPNRWLESGQCMPSVTLLLTCVLASLRASVGHRLLPLQERVRRRGTGVDQER